MNVTVPNQLPQFDDNTTFFSNLTVSAANTFTMTIPPFSDPDLTTPGIRFEQVPPNLTATLNGTNSLSLSPTFSEIGVHQTYVVLFDSLTEVKFPLQINVTNTVPYFTSPSLPFPMIQIAQNMTSSFPFTFVDAENNTVTVTIYDTLSGTKVQGPTALVKLDNPNQISINSSNFADIGLHQIDIKISDG